VQKAENSKRKEEAKKKEKKYQDEQPFMMRRPDIAQCNNVICVPRIIAT
jgi:hypothetical protein